MISPSQLIATAVAASSLVLPVASSAQVVKHVPMAHGTSMTRQAAHATHPTFQRPGGTASTTHMFPGMPGMGRGMMNGKNMVMGTVASINGTSLTLTGSNNTTYTVDASQAKLMGGMMTGTGLSLTHIQVGDKLMVVGTVNGTTITAKTLADQSFEGRNIFSGSVTAVNGSTLTISGRAKSGTTTYTLDVSGATITKGMMKNQTTIQASDVVVGDHVSAVGSLSGSTVHATNVVDMGVFKKIGQGKGGHHK